MGCFQSTASRQCPGHEDPVFLASQTALLSFPSVLVSQKVAANSFSMCFGDDSKGKITFGDKGSSDQSETPFNLKKLNPHYNISILQINVGKNVSRVDDLYAIFDSGTSFTYLNDPAYSLIAEKFDAQIKDRRDT